MFLIILFTIILLIFHKLINFLFSSENYPSEPNFLVKSSCFSKSAEETVGFILDIAFKKSSRETSFGFKSSGSGISCIVILIAPDSEGAHGTKYLLIFLKYLAELHFLTGSKMAS